MPSGSHRHEGLDSHRPEVSSGDILGTPQVTKTDGLQEVLVLVYTVEAYAQEAILALELADAAEVLVTCARTRPLNACVEVVNEVVLTDGQQGSRT